MSGKHISRIGQIQIYIGKCFRVFFNEKGWKCFISTFIIALVLSWIIGDNTFQIFESTETGLFALICGCIWTGIFNSIQSICKERAIIKREHRTGLHISSYILAHAFFEFVICAVEALIFTIVFAIVREVPSSGVITGFIIFEYFISFLFITFASDCLGLLVSCIVKRENTAMTVMPFILIVQLVLSGVMFELPEKAAFVKEITVSKWGLCALCSSSNMNEIPSAETIRILEEKYENKDKEEIDSFKALGIKQEFLSEYESSTRNIAFCWFFLTLFCGLYLLFGIIALKQVDKDKR